MVYRYSWTKVTLFRRAIAQIRKVLAGWSIPPPVFHDTSCHRERYGSGGKLYGHFDPPQDVWVNVAASTQPPRIRGRIWSYPGYKADRTAAGIAAHETGHYLWHARLTVVQRREWCLLWQATRERVSGYEPLPTEGWAETMRLAILNPDLLRRGCPQRYVFIERCGFVPLRVLPWRRVLRNAPSFIVEAAQKFAREHVSC